MSGIYDVKKKLLKSSDKLEQDRRRLAEVLNYTNEELMELSDDELGNAHANFKASYKEVKGQTKIYVDCLLSEMASELIRDDRLMKIIGDGNITKETDYIISMTKAAIKNSLVPSKVPPKTTNREIAGKKRAKIPDGTTTGSARGIRQSK